MSNGFSRSSTRIPYTKPSITELERSYVADAVASGWGEHCYDYIYRFEREFAEHLGVKHVIATSSCTGALTMGLAAVGLGPGDEVILADSNWVATLAPIVHHGATPVLVDILQDTWCIDPELVKQAITPKTKAIIATHLYGNLCEMRELLEIGAEKGVPVIEDAAEAIGSVYFGQRAGSMGYFSTFSFHGTKTITTGEGGAFCTNDSDLYERVLTLSNHGRQRGETRQFWASELGYKFKMSNIQAALGCAQLRRVEDLVAKKRENLSFYVCEFREHHALRMNQESPNCRIGAWMPTVVIDSELGLNIEGIVDRLLANGMDVRRFFWPLSTMFNLEARFPLANSTAVHRHALNLPSFHEISFAQLDEIAVAFLTALNE